MTSRITFSAALLGAFLLGLFSIHPVAQAVQMFSVVKCSMTSTCTGGSNASSGPGVVGYSTKGNGIVATTSFPSTSASKYRSGLVGEDLSKTGKFDAGVEGTSARGTGILGTSSSLIGVNGISSTNTGVWGQVNSGSKQPTGVFGIDASKSAAGAGVAGQSNAGSGVVGSTLGGSNSQALLGLAPSGGYVFVGAGPGNQAVATLDGAGNLTIAGQVTTSGQCYGGCAKRREQSYGTTAAAPTIEDSGEAQLVGGAAFVRLDPNFYNVIDPRQGYFVLITPESETRGLYVSQRAASGFTVRENLAGRSSGMFAYRIVAHPYGVRAARLPYVQTRAVPDMVRSPQTPQGGNASE